MSRYDADISGASELTDAISSYEGNAGTLIDEVLHGEGAATIKEEIARLLPESGRTWKKKAAPAIAAMPGAFSQDNEALGVVIAARGRYGYLYFPDDGSNTMRHAGGLHFMQQGGDNASQKIIDLCIGKLTEGF